MKRIFVSILALVMLCSAMLCTPASAAPLTDSKTVIEYLDNGDYIETIISWEENSTRSYKTATKTTNYLNNYDEIMWSVTVRGTFYYDGSRSSCNSVSHSTTSPSAYWSIKSSSSTRSGNTATANAVATFTVGSTSKDYSMSVSLTCSADGTLS